MSCLEVRLAGERVRIGVEGTLAEWFEELYGTGARRISDDAVPLVLRASGLWRGARLVRRTASREELRQVAEWAVTCEAARRARARSVVLHGAWVATKRSAVLILGKHGYGKTTLAVRLALGRGWRLLADDAVVLRRGRIEAVARPVRLKPGSDRVLPELARLKFDRAPWREDWPALVPLQEFSRGGRSRPTRNVVVLGKPSARAVRVERLPAGLAVAEVAKYVWSFRERPAESLEAIVRFLKGRAVHRVSGGELDEREAAIAAVAR